jgi:hypothetical protein
MDEADELGWRPADVVDRPGVVALLLNRSLVCQCREIAVDRTWGRSATGAGSIWSH